MLSCKWSKCGLCLSNCRVKQFIYLLHSAAVGLRGMQLFVDAGIPLDAELVRNLITEVLQEKVAAMLGYPKPQNPPKTQEVCVSYGAILHCHTLM